VTLQIVAAITASAAVAVFLPPLLPRPAAADAASRIVLVAPWLVLMGLPVLSAVASVANYRFFSATAITGAIDPADQDLAFRLRLLANASEQCLLALPAFAALALMIPADRLNVPPVLACWHVVARVLFVAGYRRRPLQRAFGFAATFWTTVGVVAAVFWLVFV
jgi:uncharacterized membrane protein YecN with MAPEG domain